MIGMEGLKLKQINGCQIIECKPEKLLESVRDK
ncbi:hypothetical protein SAMN05216353_13612 [Halobacillus alkaliphilus]|uniref:Uncharacterized protein n=1 Tax=Halobacillus alkaliphilus TaxID=396056 RepID=A0A1I2QZU4_9BACI|nr:hypothetical protein SAMN05216353_13612 [Halobacillus alkaliphilus]